MTEDARERALGAFVDAAPLTVAEVAAAADLAEDEAREALTALVEAGDLRRKEVRGVDISQRKAAEAADVDLAAPVVLYYRTAEDLRAGVGTADGADADPADPVGRRLARMDVPGSSEMMRSWRRDAVRAAYDHLREAGPAAPEAIREAVYHAHEAGFDDADAWWACVRPRLATLPGVVAGDGEWRVEDAD